MFENVRFGAATSTALLWFAAVMLYGCGIEDSPDPEDAGGAGAHTYNPNGDNNEPKPSKQEQCVEGGWFTSLCAEDPTGYACVSICSHAEENCGNPDLCTVSFYDSCVSHPDMPHTVSDCEDFLCYMGFAVPPPGCEGLEPQTSTVPEGEPGVVVTSSGDKDFLIQTMWGNSVFEAWTYCFWVLAGDEVVFLEPTAVCVYNTFVVLRTGDECKVWCK